MEKLAEDVDVRIEAGVQSTNSQQCISLNPLYIALGKTFFQSLPGYSHWPACDYTDSFCRRSKVKPLKIPVKNVKAQQLFYDIDVNPTITAPMIVLFS